MRRKQKDFEHRGATHFPALDVPFLVAPSSLEDRAGQLVALNSEDFHHVHPHPPSKWTQEQNLAERHRAEAALRESKEFLDQLAAERTTELRQSEARFRLLAEVAFEGIVISEEGLITDSNSQFARMFGYAPEEVLRRPLAEFIGEAAERAGTNAAMEFSAVRKDGSVFPAEAHGRTMNQCGRKMRATAVRDLTPLRQARADLESQRRKLASFQRLAELSEISQGVIHQIGQPLSAIVANISAARCRLAACPRKPCEAAEVLFDVEADLKRIRDTVHRLRALAHPERPHRQLVNLNQVIRALVPHLQNELVTHGIHLRMNLADNLPLVPVDEIQIGQALFNLLRNALQSVAACALERRKVLLRTHWLDPDRVEVSVIDYGMGLSMEVQERLFEPLFTTRPDGMGIGLSLVQTIVKAHGGGVEGFNNDGPGATFRLILPVRRVET